MTYIDKKVVERHMDELEEALKYLNGKKSLSVKDLLSDLEVRYAVERALQLSIQSVLDVGNHLLAAMSVNRIKTLADIPAKLAEKKVIGKKLALRLVGMARFRNILVHEYVTIDTKRMRAFLVNNLDDFRQFVRAVQRFIG